MDTKLKKTLKVVKECCEALDDKKAMDIKVLKVAEKSSITDYFVIASGTSEPHIRAMKNEIERKLKDMGVKDINVDFHPNSDWIVIDGFDFMIHLFGQETRELYSLEKLWKDAEEIDINDIK